ncbi:MAG: hypothetical protein AB7E42_03300 [Anaerotignaceae bacterium]
MTKDYNINKISKNKYKELQYFCLQYKEKKDRINSMCYISAVQVTGMPHGSGISNPTAQQGEEIAELKRDIELIEQTAIAVSSEFYQQLIENATKGVPWEYLDIPLSRRSFYRLKAKYFQLLAIRKSWHKCD